MARPARTVGEVEIAKKKIISAAMEILYKDGFELLSMKKIGSKLGMTAANLYNYFSSKDELYIEMRRYGFLELYDRLDTAVREGKFH
jgi:AcrR family transcriptional regulator